MGASSSSEGSDDRACRQCGGGGRDVPADATGASFLHTAAGKAVVANLVSGKLTRNDLERLFDAFDADTDGALPAADAHHMFRALVSAVTGRASQQPVDDAAAAPEEVSAYHARVRAKGAGAAAADEALIVAEWQREFGGAKALTKDEFTAKGGGGLYAALKKGLAAAEPAAAAAADAGAATAAPAPDTAARAPTVAGASAAAAAGAGAAGAAAAGPAAAGPTAGGGAGSPEVRAASASIGDSGRGAAMSTVSVSGPGGVVDMVAAQNRGASPSVGPWAQDRSASNSVQGDGAGDGAAQRQATAAQGDVAVRQASTVSVADSTRGMSPSVAITHMTSKLVEAQEKAVENMHQQT